MALFSSKTLSSTQLFDQRAGASGAGSAVSNPRGDVNIGSDAVAQAAISSSNEALMIASNFLAETFSKTLSATNQAQERADRNITANQELAASLLQGEQESADDRLLKVVMAVLAAGVVVVVMASGQLKGFFK